MCVFGVGYPTLTSCCISQNWWNVGDNYSKFNLKEQVSFRHVNKLVILVFLLINFLYPLQNLHVKLETLIDNSFS